MLCMMEMMYDEEWRVDKELNGKGVYKVDDRLVYDKEFKNGVCGGKGIYKFASGSVYQGEWKDGSRNGKGIMKFASRDVCEGEWDGSKFNGKGKYTYEDGRVSWYIDGGGWI